MAQSLCTVSCMVMYHSAQHSSTMVPDLGPSWGNSGAREVKLMLCWVALAQVEPWGYLGYLGPRYFGAMLSHEASWGHVGGMLGVLEGEADHQVTGKEISFFRAEMHGVRCEVCGTMVKGCQEKGKRFQGMSGDRRGKRKTCSEKRVC